MAIDIKLDGIAARTAAILLGLCVCAVLTFAALVNLAVGMLTDERANVSTEVLATTVNYLPHSASLNARLAQAELENPERDISAIKEHATRAANQSPWDYRQRLRLATVLEASGDRAAAERSLQQALALAPNYTEVHWRLAHVLLRERKLASSVREFQTATSSNPALLPATLDLLWRVSGGNVAVVEYVTPNDTKSRVILAQFLLKESRASDAITILNGIDRSLAADLPQSAEFISSLLSLGLGEQARGLWAALVSGTHANTPPDIWNGNFESDSSKKLPHFDWSVTRNEYAVPSIDSSTAHTGNRSLRIDFTGLDTARLDGQVKQTLVLRPNARYRLECYIKTERLDTPLGPRVVISGTSSSSEWATSDPIPSGSSDWRKIAIDFTTPANAGSAILAIKRIPQFSYDKPTRGTVWFDDFALNEQRK